AGGLLLCSAPRQAEAMMTPPARRDRPRCSLELDSEEMLVGMIFHVHVIEVTGRGHSADDDAALEMLVEGRGAVDERHAVLLVEHAQLEAADQLLGALDDAGVSL